MAVFLRLWAVAVATLALVVALFVGLAILNFKQIQTDLLGGRLAVLAEMTAEPFEAAARIGLPLGSVRNSAALLERARQSDDAIAGVYVIGADGAVIRATGDTALHMPSGNTEGTRWSWSDADHLFSAVRIIGAAGQPLGAVVVEIDRRESTILVRAMAAELLTSALAIWSVMSALSGAGIWLWLRPQITAFRGAEEQIEAFEQDLWSGRATADRANSGDLGHALRAALSGYRQAMRDRGDEHG